MTQFYIYIHRKPDGTPFYVGKGHGKRAYKRTNRNPHHTALFAKYGDEIIIDIINAESEQHAFQLEREHIAMFKDQGYRLANQTDGGEGVTGYQFDNETIERIAEINRTKVRSDEFKQRVSEQWSGVKRGPQSKEHRRKNADAKRGNTFRRGAKHTESSIAAMRDAHIGKTMTNEQKHNYSICKVGVSNGGIGLAGVNWVKNMGKWRVQLHFKGKRHMAGYFPCLLDAVAARFSLQQQFDVLYKQLPTDQQP